MTKHTAGYTFDRTVERGTKQEKASRYAGHFKMHEARREQYGLPSQEEEPCDACDKGKTLISEGVLPRPN